MSPVFNKSSSQSAQLALAADVAFIFG
jgi:hypothetical protein